MRSRGSRVAAGRWGAIASCALALSGGTASWAKASTTDGTGQPGPYTMVDEPLDAVTSASVNVASGNLLLNSQDLTAADPTYNVTYGRYYNSRAAASSGLLGSGWTLDRGPQVALQINSDGTVELHGPNNYDVVLSDPDGDQTYSGLLFDGTLVKNADGTYSLNRYDDDDSYAFSAAGELTSVSDIFGTFTMANTSAAGKTVLSSYGTASGRRINVSYNGDSRIREIDDPASGHRYYSYDSGGRLTQYSSPTGIATYTYSPAGLLTQVDLPSGASLTISYADSTGRVASMTATPAGGPARTTTFSYSTGQTQVVDPGGTTTTYSYGSDFLVTGEAKGASPPSLTLSGSLVDAAAASPLPAGAYGLHFETDAPTASEVDVDVAGVTDDSFDPSSGDWSLDTDDYQAGRNVITVVATAPDGSLRSRSIFVELPAPTYAAGDGTTADDTPFDAANDGPITLAQCESDFGVGADECDVSAGGSSRASLRASSTASLIYGISDDDVGEAKGLNRSYLDSPLFADLKVKRVRRIVAYNLVDFPNRLAAFRRFYSKAVSKHLDITVAFQFGCTDDGTSSNAPGACYRDGSGNEPPPSRNAYVTKVRAFEQHFPKVHWFSAWNEPNHPRQPLNAQNSAHKGGPSRAAQYAYWLERYVCAKARANSTPIPCDVVAGDFFQVHGQSEISYLRRYKTQLDALFQGSGLREPTTWALHPYVDIKAERTHLTSSGTHKMLREIGTADRLWLTEGGSRLDSALNHGRPRNNPTTQARETAYYVDELGTMSRVDRLYYYSLCPGDSTFDSGLLDSDGGDGLTGYCSSTPRPAYTTFKTRTNRNPNG